MNGLNERITRMSAGGRAALAAALFAVGAAAGGVGGASLARPVAIMAPATPSPIGRLAASTGIVTVRGRVADVFGDRFVIADATGRAMVAAGPREDASVTIGQRVLVQGRFEDGQLRASYLVTPDGTVRQVGPQGRGGHDHREHRDGPDSGRDRIDVQPSAPAGPRVGEADTRS